MAINKGLQLRNKLSVKLNKYGQTVTRSRPPYRLSGTQITTSDKDIKVLDAGAVSHRYQDIGKYADVLIDNQNNPDLTIYIAVGNEDVKEGDSFSYLGYKHKVTRVHPFVLQDVLVYLEITVTRERKTTFA